MIKSLKNVGGNLTHFCLGPKTEFGCWDLRFSVRSKIHAFCGTLLREVLILVPNQNRAKKIYAGFLPGLEITSLKVLESDLVLILFLLSFFYKATPVSRKNWTENWLRNRMLLGLCLQFKLCITDCCILSNWDFSIFSQFVDIICGMIIFFEASNYS